MRGTWSDRHEPIRSDAPRNARPQNPNRATHRGNSSRNARSARLALPQSAQRSRCGVTEVLRVRVGSMPVSPVLTLFNGTRRSVAEQI